MWPLIFFKGIRHVYQNAALHTFQKAERFNYSGEGLSKGVTFVLLRAEHGCDTLRIDDIHPLMIRALRSGKLHILFDPTENKSRFWSDRPHIQEIVGVQRTTYDLYSSFKDFKGAPAPKN